MQGLSFTVLFLAMRRLAADAVTGAAAKNAQCPGCHSPVAAQLEEKVVHQALEMGCEACHIEHLADGANSKAAHFVNAAQPALCAGCHDLKSETLDKAHHGQPLDKALCSGCHNPQLPQRQADRRAPASALCGTAMREMPRGAARGKD